MLPLESIQPVETRLAAESLPLSCQVMGKRPFCHSLPDKSKGLVSYIRYKID